MKSIGEQIRQWVARSGVDTYPGVPITGYVPGLAKSVPGVGRLPRLSNRFQVELVSLDELHPPSRQVRRHSERQLAKLSANIRRFDFLVPVLATEAGELISGTARVEAARRCDLKTIPVIRITHLSAEEIRAFRLADNRLVELGDWDEEQLAIELKELSPKLLRDLHGGSIMILRNHGVLVCGESVAECVVNHHWLEMACQGQIAALTAGEGNYAIPSKEACEYAHSQFKDAGNFLKGGKDWAACLRLADRLDPSYKD